MEEITNHNCAGICSEKTCDELETQFIQLNFNELFFIVGFCAAHAEEFDNKLHLDKEKMAHDWRTLCKSKLTE